MSSSPASIDSSSVRLKPLIVVAGPTASGKSALGVALASELGTEIVSLDSVQCFKEFNIGSAKPSLEEQALVPHHMIDVFEPDFELNAKVFVDRMEQAIGDVVLRKGRAVVIGGTTMYLTALLQGLVESPEIPSALRDELRAMPLEKLRVQLEEKDPLMAGKLSARDRPRMERALAVTLVSGEPFSQQQARHAFQNPKHTALVLVPMWSREQLYARINDRVDGMLVRGLLEETRRIVEQYGESPHALRSLGYAQCLSVLRGEIEHGDLPAAIAQATRRFAKRQLTYFRNEPWKRGWSIVPTQERSMLSERQGQQVEARAGEHEIVAQSVSFGEVLGRIRELEREGISQTEVWFVDAPTSGLWGVLDGG